MSGLYGSEYTARLRNQTLLAELKDQNNTDRNFIARNDYGDHKTMLRLNKGLVACGCTGNTAPVLKLPSKIQPGDIS